MDTELKVKVLKRIACIITMILILLNFNLTLPVQAADNELSIPGDSGSSAYFGIYTLGRYISFASNN